MLFMAGGPSGRRSLAAITEMELGKAVGEIGRAVDRVHGHVEARRARPPGPQLVAQEQAGRVVLGALADDDFAGDVDQVEHTADGITGGRVRLLLLAPAQPGEHVERRVLRRADELELDRAFRVRCR